MAELSTIARPYAEALFRVASEDTNADALKNWSSLVDSMGAVASDPDMRRVLADPRVTGDQVYSVFVAALGSEPDTHAQNFVRMLIDNDRLGVMPEIATQFGLLVDAKQGSAEAKITSAFPMDDADVADLVGALEKKFAIKLKPVVDVDAALIGGVRVVVGDRVLDTSVRSRLDAMKAALIS
jgi:F-type H+-transporting ATPase subunit delta